MERSLLKELKNVNLVAYMNRQKDFLLQRMFWQQFFPLKPTLTLTWETLSGTAGAPVMADVIEFDASAPLKTRRVVTHAKGDIPGMGIKRKMDARDFNDYNTYKALARGDADKLAILDIIFRDVDFVYAGVMARTEYLAMQALSYGSISLNSANNNGIITETAVDFGIPSGNKTAVSTIWATAGSATPIADIREVVQDIEDAGHICNHVIMDKAQWAKLIATTEAKDAYAFYQGVTTGRIAVPGIEGINNMLTSEGLPTISIVQSSVRHETSAHVLSSLAPWKAGYVTFLPDKIVGNVLHAPIAEEGSPEIQKVATVAKVGHVFTSKWAVLDPFGEFTKAQANAFPVFNDVEQVYILKTDDTSWS